LIKAKKRFGQNFLKDESILERIIQSMPNDGKKIVEIGPGLGDLTKKLLDSSEREVVAFEIDLELCDYLQDKFKNQLQTKELTLVCNDVIKEWDNRESLLHEPYHLIANLPYYVATNIILRALEETHCSSILVMIQKEVAQKFSAEVGNNNFSALSVLASTVSDCRILFDVPPECFDPAPKVMSSILWLSKKNHLLVNSSCANVEKIKRRYALWPSAVEPWMGLKYTRRGQFPKVDPRCEDTPFIPVDKIKIIGIDEHNIYQSARLEGELPSITLLAKGGQGKQDWFINGQFFVSSDPYQGIPYQLTQIGENQIVVIDQQGNVDQVKIILSRGI